MMSSERGFYLGDGPSGLTYKRKICPKCGDFTAIRVSHSYRNPDKLYYWCNTHRFVDWCLPTNVETMNPTVGINQEKRDEDVKRDMDHDMKIAVKTKLMGITASCKGNSIPSVLCIAVVVIAFIVISPKLMP